MSYRLFLPAFVLAWLTLVAVAWSADLTSLDRAHDCFRKGNLECAERLLKANLSKNRKHAGSHFLLSKVIVQAAMNSQELSKCYTMYEATDHVRLAVRYGHETYRARAERESQDFAHVAGSPYFKMILSGDLGLTKTDQELRELVKDWIYTAYAWEDRTPEEQASIPFWMQFLSGGGLIVKRPVGEQILLLPGSWSVSNGKIHTVVEGVTRSYYLGARGDLVNVADVESCENEVHPDLRNRQTTLRCLKNLDRYNGMDYVMWSESCGE